MVGHVLESPSTVQTTTGGALGAEDTHTGNRTAAAELPLGIFVLQHIAPLRRCPSMCLRQRLRPSLVQARLANHRASIGRIHIWTCHWPHVPTREGAIG